MNGAPAQPPRPAVAAACPSRLGTPARMPAGVVLGGIVALAALLRFAGLGHKSLWFDEAYVLWVGAHRWGDVFPLLASQDYHPPLYYLLIKAWSGVAGTGEAAVRVPSACFSVLCVPLTYALARRVASEPVGLLSAFLVSVSPFQVMAGQEARMYPLLGALTLASTLALAAGVERGGRLRWAGYAVLAVLLVYTQYLGFLVLLAHGVWVLGWERRHGGAWLVAMAGAAGLYAPWVPVVWHEVWGQYTRAWPQQTLFGPGALLGLFAFGGSLFGMRSYFLPGTLSPMEQVILLLPFLVVLWRGAASYASDRRGLALIGLPPALIIGVMLAVALGRLVLFVHGFWFSFLVPFYAMFVAGGLVDVVERVGGQRDRVLAFVTAGLLLYSVPVLGRYYFDPSFWPFRWRDAADLVRAQVRSGDFFIYVGREAALPFEYYFREPHAGETMRPGEAGPERSGHPEFTSAQAEALAARHGRIWLIIPYERYGQTRRWLLPALDSAFRGAGYYDFTGAWVLLLEAKPGHGADVVRHPPSPVGPR